MDLLGRKVLMEGGKGLQLLATRINDTIQRAMARPELAGHANELAKALQEVGATTKAAWATDDPQQALANAVPYMQAFGHTVLAWTWLDVSLAVLDKDPGLTAPANAGRMAAMRYFFGYELPKIGAWLKVVRERDMTCAQMSEEAF
jgi:butyryl-CoA dehydrogenase